MLDQLVEVGVANAVAGGDGGARHHAFRNGSVVDRMRAAHEVGQLVRGHVVVNGLLVRQLQLGVLLLRQRRLRHLQQPADDERQLVEDEVVEAARVVVDRLQDVHQHFHVDVGRPGVLAVEDERESLAQPVHLLDVEDDEVLQ